MEGRAIFGIPIKTGTERAWSPKVMVILSLTELYHFPTPYPMVVTVDFPQALFQINFIQ